MAVTEKELRGMAKNGNAVDMLIAILPIVIHTMPATSRARKYYLRMEATEEGWEVDYKAKYRNSFLPKIATSRKPTLILALDHMVTQLMSKGYNEHLKFLS